MTTKPAGFPPGSITEMKRASLQLLVALVLEATVRAHRENDEVGLIAEQTGGPPEKELAPQGKLIFVPANSLMYAFLVSCTAYATVPKALHVTASSLRNDWRSV